MKIVLGDIEMSTNVADIDGSVWLATGLEGWDSPDVRGGANDYAGKDGAALTRSTHAPRALVLQGICKTVGGEAGFWKAYNRLTGVTGILSGMIDLQVTEDVDKTMRVRKNGKIRKQIKPAHFVFEVPLTAPNPAKYGAEVSVNIAPGGTVVVNNGSVGYNYLSEGVRVVATTTGTLKVTNSTQGKTVSSGTKSVVATTEVDFRERTIMLGDLNRYFQLATTSNWWSLNPGANTIKNEGTAAITLYTRPAWI